VAAAEEAVDEAETMNGRVVLDEATGALPVSLAPETAARRHATAFDAIFIEHYPRVVGIIARVVNDRSRAEQLAADVFWKLYRKALFRPDESNVGGWLYRAALRVGLDALRMASRRSRHEAAAAAEQVRQSGSSDPLAAVLLAEQRALVRATLAALKPRQARLLLLRGCGLSYQEIANVLKLNPRSIGTLLARAEEAFERQHRALHSSKG
jgi:RNA polymerase sigma-70 factor (ECF subfamily)